MNEVNNDYGDYIFTLEAMESLCVILKNTIPAKVISKEFGIIVGHTTNAIFNKNSGNIEVGIELIPSPSFCDILKNKKSYRLQPSLHFGGVTIRGTKITFIKKHGSIHIYKPRWFAKWKSTFKIYVI